MEKTKKVLHWLATMMVALIGTVAAMACGEVSEEIELTDGGGPTEFIDVDTLERDLSVCSSTSWKTISVVAGTTWDYGLVCDGSWTCEYTFYSYSTTFSLPVTLLANGTPNHIHKYVGSDHVRMFVYWNYGNLSVKASYQTQSGAWLPSPNYQQGLRPSGSSNPSANYGYVSRAQFGIPSSVPMVLMFEPRSSAEGYQVLNQLGELVCNR